jgi:plastocyanin
MSTPLVATHTQERTRISVLRRVMIAGLVGNVVMNVIVQALIVQALIVPLTIISVLTLVIAGVCATRWRWAPLLAVLWVVVSVVPGAEPYTYNLTHPAEGEFISTLIGLVLLLIAVVAGVAATVSGERQGAEGSAPRWLMRFLIGTASFVLGASLVATIPPPEAATAGVSAEALVQLPALVSGRNTFEQAELRARVGQTVALRLENRDTQTHSFDIDAFNVHVAMPSSMPALALFTPSTPGSYTFYCSVPGHREAGMVGTLIVEP